MSDKSSRKHLNADQKRALKAADIHLFVQKYQRKAQRGVEPNDRSYDHEVENTVKRMKPEDLDRFLRGEEE